MKGERMRHHMTFLDEKTQQKVQDMLKPITKPVEMAVFTRSMVLVGQDEPGMQRETVQLLQEIASLNEHLRVIEKLFSDDEAQALGLAQAPTTLLREAGSSRSNIRFLGIPSGYEFSTLLETLLMLGTGESKLSENLQVELAKVETPVHMQSFVTPTCPYCPRAVLTAYKFAFHNPNVLAEGIEASEFPILSNRYRIQGVPDTIISAQTEQRVLGGQPERVFLEATFKALATAA
jgi:glutaredoxin-like protein